MNRYISKSYTTRKNAIDWKYTQGGVAVVSTITYNCEAISVTRVQIKFKKIKIISVGDLEDLFIKVGNSELMDEYFHRCVRRVYFISTY